jgi:hypothetical protein
MTGFSLPPFRETSGKTDGETGNFDITGIIALPRHFSIRGEKGGKRPHFWTVSRRIFGDWLNCGEDYACKGKVVNGLVFSWGRKPPRLVTMYMKFAIFPIL